jgi:hypothetical protein
MEAHADQPVYHLYDPNGWVNDPNGPLYYKGQYHMWVLVGRLATARINSSSTAQCSSCVLCMNDTQTGLQQHDMHYQGVCWPQPRAIVNCLQHHVLSRRSLFLSVH